MKNIAIKSTLNVPWLEDFYGINGGKKFEVRNAQEAYGQVSLLYRAVNLRRDTLSKVPIYIYRGETEVEAYPYEKQLPLRSWVNKQEFSLLLSGAAYTVQLQNKFGRGKGLQVLNPFTMKVRETLGGLVFEQTVEGKIVGLWPEDEMIYIREESPLTDYEPGVAPINVALTDGKLLSSVSAFLEKYFSSGAIPVTLITAKNLSEDKEVNGKIITGERTRLQDFFQKRITGLRNAFRVLALSNEVKIEKLTSDLNTFDIKSLDEHAVNSIAWAFGIPKTLLTADAANYATAEVDMASFISNTVVPRCRLFEGELNKYLEQFSLRMEFCENEMPSMQADEADRSASLKSLVDSGVPLLAALDMLGYDLSDEAEALILAEVNKPKPIPPQLPPMQPPMQPAPTDPMNEDMQKWYRKALKSFRMSKGADVEFISDAIPQEVKSKIESALKTVKNEIELLNIFGEKDERN